MPTATESVTANEQKIADLNRQLEELADRRRKLAVDVATGTSGAADSLAATESAIAGTKVKIERLQLARDGLSDLAAQEGAAAEDERRRDLAQQLAGIESEQLATYLAIEAATSQLVEAIERSAAIALQLESLERELGRPRLNSVHGNRIEIADFLSTKLIPVGAAMLPGRYRPNLVDPASEAA